MCIVRLTYRNIIFFHTSDRVRANKLKVYKINLTFLNSDFSFTDTTIIKLLSNKLEALLYDLPWDFGGFHSRSHQLTHLCSDFPQPVGSVEEEQRSK